MWIKAKTGQIDRSAPGRDDVAPHLREVHDMPACAEVADRPISIAAPRLAIPLMKVMASSFQAIGRRASSTSITPSCDLKSFP
jgi:hypothetical protein